MAARLGDGLWTLADPENAPEIIEAYRDERESAGREPGEIILQAGFSWAADDDAALEGARVWKATMMTSTSPTTGTSPRRCTREAEQEISDDDFRAPVHRRLGHRAPRERIREIEELGPTVICLQNASGADPHAALQIYGAEVLPALRGHSEGASFTRSEV